MTNGALGRRGVFELTAALEGHPDNVGPCVFGGFTVAASDETGAFLEAAFPDRRGKLYSRRGTAVPAEMRSLVLDRSL